MGIVFFNEVKSVSKHQRHKIICKSKKMLNVLKALNGAARRDDSIVISGEDGCGKEFAARFIHIMSNRKKAPFVVFKKERHDEICDLFFVKEDDGRIIRSNNNFEHARGGTFYIHGLKFVSLEEQRILFNLITGLRKKSGPKGNPIRLILSIPPGFTGFNENIDSKEKYDPEFLSLFHSEHIIIPPLREREADILPLAEFFLDYFCKKFEMEKKEFSQAVKDYMLKCRWPNNVKELKETIKFALVVSNSKVIQKRDFVSKNIAGFTIHDFLDTKLRDYVKGFTKLNKSDLYDSLIAEVEKSLLKIVLRETRGCQIDAAKTLGISRNTVRSKIKKYSIQLDLLKEGKNRELKKK